MQETRALPVAVLVIIGLNVVAWLSSVFSFVLKMGLFAHLLVLVGAFILMVIMRDEIFGLLRFDRSERYHLVWLIGILGLVIAILYAVKPPSNPDTILYHAQAIHWIENYPAVPGLGNLDPRLGAASNWFVINALFSFAFLHIQSFHLIQSLLFLICLVYFWGGLKQFLLGDVHASVVAKVAFVPLMIYVSLDEISSPGTDLPVILLYWIIICLWLETFERDSVTSHYVAIFFVSVMAVTFKMSGAPMILIALWIAFEGMRKHNHRSLWVYMGILVFSLTPWLFRNLVLSGYWLYPLPSIKFLSPSVDWAMSIEKVAAFKAGVQSWAISPGLRSADIADLSKMEQWRLWFTDLTRNQRSIVVLAAISPLLYVLESIFFSRHGINFKKYFVVVALSYLCVIFWFLTAPNIRFGYGYLLGIIVVAGAPLLELFFKILGAYRIHASLVIALLISAQFVNGIIASSNDDTRYVDLLILPADYQHVSSVPCELGNATIQCAYSWRRCSYEAFPCVPVPLKNVEMRSDSFKDGFRLASPNDD